MKNAEAYLLLVGLAAAAAAIYVARRRAPQGAVASGTLVPISVTAQTMNQPAVQWTPPPPAEPYLPTVYEAERQYAIPHNLLARLLDQESGYRPDVISGAVRSSAGAVGIAQLIPQYFPGVDPTNWIQAIDAAAKYLAQLHARFGTWSLALAAYNWGPGNVDQWISTGAQSAAMPAETQNYVRSIARDVAVA